MRFKTWLRGPGPDGLPVVELIGDADFEADRPHWEHRSLMAELLTEEERRHLEISEGRWHLPGRLS